MNDAVKSGDTTNKWTRFMDMHSGGGLKEDYALIFIEAPEGEAEVIFYNRFGHNPYRVTCTCCGEDYSVDGYDSLAEATAYDRHCAYVYIDKHGVEHADHDWYNLTPAQRKELGSHEGPVGRYVERGHNKGWGDYQTLEQYLQSEGVLFIRAKDIKPEEREGTVPAQGYVWVD